MTRSGKLPPFLQISSRLVRESEFGRALHQFLYRPKALHLLDGIGTDWGAGGCRILAEALCRLAAAYKTPHELWVIGRDYGQKKGRLVDHFAVRLEGDIGFVFLDADGPSWEAEFRLKFQRFDLGCAEKTPIYLAPYTEVTQHPERYAANGFTEALIPRDEALSIELYRRLLQHFDRPFEFLDAPPTHVVTLECSP